MTHKEKMKSLTEKLIVKRGANTDSARVAVDENFDIAFRSCDDANTSWYADFCVSV